MISLVSLSAGQAQAFNLLVAAGNPTIKVVIAADGSMTVSTPDKTAAIGEIEPASG